MFEEKKDSLEREIYVLEEKGRERVANFEKFMAQVKEELETKIVMNDLDGPIWEDDDGASMFEQQYPEVSEKKSMNRIAF